MPDVSHKWSCSTLWPKWNSNNGTYSLTPFTNKSQHEFAKELIAYWVSFVRSGDPNTYSLPGSPYWPAWEIKNPITQNTDSAITNGKRMVLRQGRTAADIHSDSYSQNILSRQYASGSVVEEEPVTEFQRCRTISGMADRLHIWSPGQLHVRIWDHVGPWTSTESMNCFVIFGY